MKSVSQTLSGWGDHPSERCHVARPESIRALHDVVTRGEHENYVARGLGRSYGDSALNHGRGVILQSRLNRFLSFDDSNGVLQCEGGVSFAEVIKVVLPRGWFLPTTPGTKFVTIGGAIAADVHGKNHHHDGSFSNSVLDFELLVASGETLRCSRIANERAFWATIGGMGLTGVITSARIQLKRTQSAYVNVDYRRTKNLDETLDCFDDTNPDYRYSVAWIDCLASARSLGRSLAILGNDASRNDLPDRLREHPLTAPTKTALSVPFHPPGWMLNRWSVKAFNAVYYSRHQDGNRLVDYDSFFYPLDRLANWNRLYGRRGFVQYQALFPATTSRRGLIELLEKLAVSKATSFLAVLKSTGAASKGLLSFVYPGHTLALDVPNRGGVLRRLLPELDQIVLGHGGRLYLAKDSMMSSRTFAMMYPRLDEFKEVKREIDPNNRFTSSQALRLGIVENETQAISRPAA